MGFTNDVVTRIIGDNKHFDGAMRGSIQVMERFNKKGEMIGSTVKVVTKHMDDAAKRTASFKDAMTALSRDIKVSETIFNKLSGAIKGAYEAASDGAKIMAAEGFFKNAGKSIAEYRKATNGMVSDAELMKKANLADSMGIDEKTFKKLVTVAEAAALKTGQSFDYLFNSIIVGTARSSRLLLDNLGIIVSVGQANETYAKKVNKVVDALSAEEKQIAFVEEVARKSSGTLDEYAQVTDRTAESFAKFDAALQNVIDSIKVGLAKALASSGLLTDMTNMMNEMLEILRSGDWFAAGEYIGARIVQGIAKAMSWSAKTNPAFIVLNKLMEGTGYSTSSPFDWASGQAGDAASGLTNNAMLENQTKKSDAVKNAVFYHKELVKTHGEGWKKIVQGFLDNGATAADSWAADVRMFLKSNSLAENLFGAFTKSKPQTFNGTTGGGPKGKANGGLSARDVMRLDEIIQNGLLKLDERQFAEAGRKIAAPFDNSVANFDRGTSRLDAYMQDWLKRWQKLNEEYIKHLVEKNAPIGEAVNQIGTGGGLFGPIVGAIGTMMGGFSTAITGALTGAGMGGAMAGPLGAILGAVIPLIMNIIDKLSPVMAVIEAIMVGLELLVGNALLQILTPLVLLADPIKDLLAAIGLLVGSALRPLVLLFTLLVGVVAVVIEALAWAITFLSPFVEMVSYLALTLWSGGTILLGLFFDLSTATGNLRNGFDFAIQRMLDSVIWFNNGVVKFMRNTLGMKGFGKFLDREDFRGQSDGEDPIDENTSAVNENTRALRDFAREFRNMPQNYKAFGTVYASQDPQREWDGPRTSRGIGNRGVDGLQNTRWRT